jgi:hypothetical protein
MAEQTAITSPHVNKVMPRGSKYLIDIFLSDHSRGLMVDALVLQQTLGADNVRILKIPFQAYNNSTSTNDNYLNFQPAAEIALFVENLFEHSKILQYSKRIFLPNPEWLNERDKERVKSLIQEFWHKTKFSLGMLVKLFPGIEHRYIGFTSLRTPSEAKDYSSFAHFPGKSITRHTQEVINIWLKDATLPVLTFQMYGARLDIPKWIESDNLRMFIGPLDEKNLISEYINHGIHICTSQMEGFGHYINEARAVGALIITLDAPPMNELVESSFGILIPTTKSSTHNHGVRFIASQKAIEEGISQVIEMPVEERKRLGAKARIQFIKEQNEFSSRLHSIIFN